MGASQVTQAPTFPYKLTTETCSATKLRVAGSKPKMMSAEQVKSYCREPVDSTSGGPFLGANPTSIQTIEAKPNISDESSFGGLPPEIRNRIYWYASVEPAPIYLAAASHDDAASSELSRYGVPPIAQTNKQFRHECLGVYYGMNSFLFLFNAGTQLYEEGSILALWDIIDIIGRSINMIQPEAFELRFTSTSNLTFFTLQEIVLCFQSMFLNNLRPTKDLGGGIIKTTIADLNTKKSAHIREVVRRLFRLSVRLYLKPCTCEEHARPIGANGKIIGRGVRMLDCSHGRQYELERLMFCQKRHGMYSMRGPIGSFMYKRGLKRPKVRIWEILRPSFTHES